MKSKIFVTYEIDDPAIAVEELYAQLEQNLPFSTNSVGLLYCYSDMELTELAAVLHEKLDFPVIGVTAIASMDNVGGFHEMSVSLTVLTADDCEFSIRVSDPITPDVVRPQVELLYQKAVADLGTIPKLIYVLPPYQRNIMLDSYSEAFAEIAPDIPVIGGLPSCNDRIDENLTIYNDKIYSDKIVMLAISGNINPVFSVQTVLENNEVKRTKITKAKDNIVYEVDSRSFTNYLIDAGMPMDVLTSVNNAISLVANPLHIEENREGFGNEFKYLRALHGTNIETGSGLSIGRIPEGAYLSIHPLTRSEIGTAALLGVRDLIAKMKEVSAEGYQFSTVLGVSCIGRYMIMNPNGEVETENILKELPKDLNFSGFYGYGELCPLPMEEGFMTFAHNESLVLCAF